MASDYGLNFGFRRSDESMRIAEGRFRTPVGSELQIGTCVEIDPAEPGYVKVGASNVAARPGICGMLLQEEAHLRSVFEKDRVDSFDLGIAFPDKLSVITNGPGVKVWMKNTAGQTRIDGRVIPAVAMFLATNLAVGEKLGWDGTLWTRVTGGITAAHFEITAFNATQAYLEAVCLV